MAPAGSIISATSAGRWRAAAPSPTRVTPASPRITSTAPKPCAARSASAAAAISVSVPQGRPVASASSAQSGTNRSAPAKRPGMSAARVHHHLAAGAAGGGDQPGRGIPGQHALAVVGQHHDGGRRHRIGGDPHEAVGQPRVDGGALFMVGAEQLLAAGDETGLGGGGAAALHQQPGLDPRLAADQSGQVAARLVVADDGDEGHRGAQGGQVADHIAGAAGQRHLAVHRQHRHRRFRADALDPAIDVAVQHRVADDEDGAPFQLADRVQQLGRDRAGGGGAGFGRGAVHRIAVAQARVQAQGTPPRFPGSGDNVSKSDRIARLT